MLRRGTDAVSDLNRVRTSRGLTGLNFIVNMGGDYEKLIHAVFEERRKELMGEGWRWYDLIREQRLLNCYPKIGEMISNGRIYWPIADDVLEANDKLVQNEYWKDK